MKLRRTSLVALVACVACGGGNASVEPPRHPHAPKHAKRVAPVQDLGFAAQRLAVVPEGTFGPYRGSRPEGMMAAWAAEVSGKRSWLTLGLGDGSGSVHYDPKTIAEAAPEVDLVAVRPIGGATRGFILLTSSREFSGERVDLISLGTRGERIFGPTALAQSAPAIVWLDAVQTPSGAIAMWAVRRDDRADIIGVEIGTSGEPKDSPSTLVTDLRAWQVTSAGEDIAIAALTAGKERNEPGPLKLVFLDAQGKLERRSVVLSDGVTAEPDLDLAKLGDHLVAIWSDRHDGEPRLYGAVADVNGALLKPAAPIARPYGPQSVVRIVRPQTEKGQAYLAWENAIEQQENRRAVRVATLSANGVVGEQRAIVTMESGNGLPELAASSDGLAALTLAKACRRGESCDGARVVPTFVQFDASFDVVAEEPLRLSPESGEPADLAWGLLCTADCTALTVSSANPAPVYLVKLGRLSNDWVPTAMRVDDAARPRVSRVEALAKTEPLVEIAAARTGGTTTVGWLTYFDPATPFTRSKTPAPDGKYEPPRAVLRVRASTEKGPQPEPVALSYRADSPGGVAVVPGDPARGTTLVVWVGIDNKIPQAFVTVVGPDGKKIAQKMITHAKMGVGDVAAAYTGDGWALAFVDEGTNSAEVHVTKIDPTLRVVVPERRLGSGGSTASGVELLTRGDKVFAVWSDAPVSTGHAADVFAALLNAKDLALVAPEHPLSQTPGHSRAPTITPFGDGAAVAWVEDSMQSGAPSTLMLGRLDARAEVIAGTIAPIPLDGSPESASLECNDSVCHVVAAVSSPIGGNLSAFMWRGGSDVSVTKLVTLKAEPRSGLAPVVQNGDVLYADQGSRADMVVRRLGVDWE
ncbi:MAG TPA: hypothetical protein VHC69_10110 [Polyangiaceae bacterium]|nr:hypothetical protein [Polyangiaceae bacterium]